MGKFVQNKDTLSEYLPPQAVDEIYQLLETTDHVRLKISGYHATLGSCCFPTDTSPYYNINIRGDLPPYLFLEVFIHEWAHMEKTLRYPNTGVAHGKEYQLIYRQIMERYIHLFPAPLAEAIQRYLDILPTRNFHANRQKNEMQYKLDNYREYFHFQYRIDEIPIGAVFITFSIYEPGNCYTQLIKKQKKGDKWLCTSCTLKNKEYLLDGNEVVIVQQILQL